MIDIPAETTISRYAIPALNLLMRCEASFPAPTPKERSAPGQKRKCLASRGTSVLFSGADIVSLPRHIRLVPEVPLLFKLENLRQEISNKYASLTACSLVVSDRWPFFDAGIAKGEGLLRLAINDLVVVSFRQLTAPSRCRRR